MLIQLLPSSTVAAGKQAEDGHGHGSFIGTRRNLVATAGELRRHAGAVAVLLEKAESAWREVVVTGVAPDRLVSTEVRRHEREAGAVIGRARVATNADIPVAGAIHACPGTALHDHAAAVGRGRWSESASGSRVGAQHHDGLQVIRASRGCSRPLRDGTRDSARSCRWTSIGYETCRQSPLDGPQRGSQPVVDPRGTTMIAGSVEVSCGLFGETESRRVEVEKHVQAPCRSVQVFGGGDWSLANLAK